MRIIFAAAASLYFHLAIYAAVIGQVDAVSLYVLFGAWFIWGAIRLPAFSNTRWLSLRGCFDRPWSV